MGCSDAVHLGGRYDRALLVSVPSPLHYMTTVLTVLWSVSSVEAQTWRGLRVAPEFRCSEYHASDYSYPQSVEVQIVENLGSLWSPYTGRAFESRQETDMEHIVARSEAHDSGLCAVRVNTRRQLATDLLNLTLASPGVNRQHKRDHDASDWLPILNECWFADRVVRVRQKYSLTIDRREADALDRVLGSCASIALVRGGADVAERTDLGGRLDELPGGIAKWDDDEDGRITCAEAHDRGIAPVARDHPAYPYMRDRDNDGIVCESGGEGGRQKRTLTREPSQSSRSNALRQYDDNGNGRVTCAEARRHGIR